MTANSYGEKYLRVTLILPTSNFPGTSSNTLTLVGYRVSATITGAATWPNNLDLIIYGMRQQDMNALTVLWSSATPTAMNARAFVQLEASPDAKTWTQVFDGTFIEAQPDYQSIPDVGLRIQAYTGFGSQIQSVAPTSYTGATSVVQIATYLAGQMGFALENNGVTDNLANPYFPGTYMDQFRQLCTHAGIDFYFDGNATLAICPKNQPRQNKPKPIFSPDTGLIGFPTIQRYGIHVDVLFTPALTLGGEIQIQGSQVPSANGTWLPYRATHRLESLQPGGEWFSSLDCTLPSAITSSP